MFFKGIIVEIKEEYSIVMTDNAEFFRIKNKKGMKVGDKIYFLDEDIYCENEKNIIKFDKNNKKSKNIYKKLISIAATIAIIVGTVIYTSAPKSYATVSFDENGSSIQLELDKNKNVNSTDIINGKLNISENENLLKILEQICKQIKSDLKNNNSGRILVALCFEESVDTKYEKDIKNLISQKFKGLNIMYIRVDKNQIKQKNNQEISIGEYAAMKMIEEDDIEGVTSEKLNKMLKDGKYEYLREEILDELEDREESNSKDIDDIDDYDEDKNINKINRKNYKRKDYKFEEKEDEDSDNDMIEKDDNDLEEDNSKEEPDDNGESD